jgi:hypothetical protein
MIIYTDPGSGAMIWQLALAFIFGITFYFGRLRMWVHARVNIKGKQNNGDAAATQTQLSSNSTEE